MLQLIKLDFNKVPISIEPRFTDIVPIINRIVSNNKLYAAKKSITLKLIINVGKRGSNFPSSISYEQWEHEYHAVPISCFVDSLKLEQALNNLISNAIKFSHPENPVEIIIGRKEAQVYITVKDSGQGIPKNELPLLFEPFTKISVKPTSGESSTGLGLSIVKAIVLAHDGDLQVDSDVGVGTTFTILLPLPSIASQTRQATPTLTPKSPIDSLTILLADDNTVIQKLVASVFKKRMHTVIIAGDGNEALKEWEESRDIIDVIIIDEDMPLMQGSEVVEQIRKKEKELGIPRVPIISCSGTSDEQHAVLLKLKGADVVCSKPFSLDMLITTVEKLNKQKLKL